MVLGLVEDGVDVALGIGGSVGEVVVVDAEDVVVVEFVVDVNVTVLLCVGGDDIEALVVF